MAAGVEIGDGGFDAVRSVVGGLSDSDRAMLIGRNHTEYRDLPRVLAGRAVAYDGGSPVGFADVWGVDGKGRLRRSPSVTVAVSQEARGKRVASAVVRAAVLKVVERARAERASRLRRFVWRLHLGNDASARAAEHAGFTEQRFSRPHDHRQFVLTRGEAERMGKEASSKDVPLLLAQMIARARVKPKLTISRGLLSPVVDLARGYETRPSFAVHRIAELPDELFGVHHQFKSVDSLRGAYTGLRLFPYPAKVLPHGDRTRSVLFDTDAWSDVRDRFLSSKVLRARFAALSERPGVSTKTRSGVGRVLRRIASGNTSSPDYKNYGELDVYRKMRLDGSNYPYAIVASGGSRYYPELEREAEQVRRMLKDRGIKADIAHSSSEFFDAMNQNAPVVAV